MKKEEFQQNMKDRMQQFEDGGLRLLKKGQKGIVHAIFSRFGLVLLLMLLQVGVLWSNALFCHVCPEIRVGIESVAQKKLMNIHKVGSLLRLIYPLKLHKVCRSVVIFFSKCIEI